MENTHNPGALTEMRTRALQRGSLWQRRAFVAAVILGAALFVGFVLGMIFFATLWLGLVLLLGYGVFWLLLRYSTQGGLFTRWKRKISS